ncbi:calpain-A-like [Neodiprion fabricii]|uniref:calpain-A-like n=1 Tax=Neodiprion fabricii TaxID=2872261 RepID=UPI001ED94065|nr:calpain-A-like [Neodiprion fabricii]
MSWVEFISRNIRDYIEVKLCRSSLIWLGQMNVLMYGVRKNGIPDDQKKYFMDIVWKHPGELAADPQFFVEGLPRFDVQQNHLYDCWAVASLCSLAMHPRLLYQVVPQDQGFEEAKYAGIFHFRSFCTGRSAFHAKSTNVNLPKTFYYLKSNKVSPCPSSSCIVLEIFFMETINSIKRCKSNSLDCFYDVDQIRALENEQVKFDRMTVFWQFGKWVDVVIDGRLPTDSASHLILALSPESNEFWAPLVEKAYVKLYGSWKAIDGGDPGEVLEDFTGGLAFYYPIFDSERVSFDTIQYAQKRNAESEVTKLSHSV